MGVVFNRRKSQKDQVTNALISRGVYRVPDIYEDDEGVKLKGAKVAYSFWSAVRYTFVLSILLWWLPIFGQMIAGYVGGRRAGSPWRGVIAALVPVIIIFAIMSAIDAGWIPTTLFGIDLSPAVFMGAIASHLPIIEPYVNFTLMYFNSFLDTIQATTSLRLDSYIITVAFAYVGGILSDQTRREMEYISRTGGPKTTVVVEGTSNSPPETTLSVPSWSSQFLQPRRVRHTPLSFEELIPVGAKAYVTDDLEKPVAPVRQVIHRDEMAERLPADERELLKNKAKHMRKGQKKVEKKIQKKKKQPVPHAVAANSEMMNLVKRAKQSNTQSLTEGEQLSESGDWEFI